MLMSASSRRPPAQKNARPAAAVRPRPSLVESSFSIHALAVQASPEPSPAPRRVLPAANTDATGMCGLELVYTPVGLSGAIEAFAFRADGKIVHSHARSASAAVWTPFRPVGDEDGAGTRKFASGPTVVRAADGRLEVVARGMDGALYVKYQLAPNGVRGWGPWVRVDGGPAFAGVPSAVLSAEGFLQLFARSASSGEIMYNGQLRNASGVYWSGWQSLGGSFAAGPWAVLDAESLLHVFAVDASGVLQENVEATAPPSGDCSWAGGRRSTAASPPARASPSSSTAPTCSRSTRRAPPTAPSPSSASRCGAAASARAPSPPPSHAHPRIPLARRRTPRSSPSAGRRAGPCSTGGARSRARRPRASPRTRTPRSCMRAPPPAASPRARSSRTRSSTPPPPAARRVSGRRGASSAPAPSSPPPPSPRRSAPAASAAPTSTSSSSAPTAARATPSAPRTPARPPPPSAPPTRRSRRRRARAI